MLLDNNTPCVVIGPSSEQASQLSYPQQLVRSINLQEEQCGKPVPKGPAAARNNVSFSGSKNKKLSSTEWNVR